MKGKKIYYADVIKTLKSLSNSKATENQLEQWAKDFYSWDVGDQVCGLFEETTHAPKDWQAKF